MNVTGGVLAEQPDKPETHEWHFSQVFGERAPGEEVQDGED